MPKCPKCGEEIGELICVTTEVAEYVVRLRDGNGLDYTKDETFTEELYYVCPKCDKKLFDNERDVIKFLKGEMKVARVP